MDLFVNTASTPGGDGTTNAIVGASRAFARSRAAFQALAGTLTEPVFIYGDGSGGADDDPPTQADFDQITTIDNFIEFRTTGIARHPGFPWDINPKYRIKVTNRNGLYNNLPSHIRFNGIQVFLTVDDGGSYIGIKTMNANQVAADIDCRIEQCIVVGDVIAGSIIGFNTRWPDAAGMGIGYVEQNMAIGCTIGFNNDAGPNAPNPGGFVVYAHNTAARCEFGYVDDGDTYAIGCLATNSGTRGFTGAFYPVSDYNAEDDGNGAPGANSLSGQVFTFVNAGADNYNLDPDDVGAKNLGPFFPQGNLAVDVSGNQRLVGAQVDIGASEAGLPGLPPPNELELEGEGGALAGGAAPLEAAASTLAPIGLGPGSFRSLAMGIIFSTLGVSAVVRRAGFPPISTIAIWATPTAEDYPAGLELKRREPTRVLALKTADVPTLPHGTIIDAPLEAGGVAIRWRVDGFEHIEIGQVRARLIRDDGSTS